MVGAAVLIGRIAAKHLLRDADLVYSTSKIRVYRKFGGERQAFQDFKAVTAKSKVTTLQVWSNLVIQPTLFTPIRDDKIWYNDNSMARVIRLRSDS